MSTLTASQLALLDRAREVADTEGTGPEVAGLLRELAALVYVVAR